MTEPSADLLGRITTALAGQYVIERELGRGGMGLVLLGRDVTLDRLVAIKVIAPELAASAELRQRFLQEARTVARLRHPNIVAVYAAGEQDGLLYFVMEYVPGESLRDLLQREQRLDAETARAILHDLALALDTAHAAGIVHRDVKPENVLLDAESGRAMLTDFGVARALQEGDGRLTGTGMVLGSPRYMSPEQAAGDVELDGRSDLYALGLIAYEALSGVSAVEAKTAAAMLVKHITETPVPIRERVSEVPEDLAAVVDVLLVKERDDRVPTGRAVAAMLRGETPTDSQPRLIAPAPERAPSGGAQPPGLRTMAGAGAAGAGAIGGSGNTTQLLRANSRKWLLGAGALAIAGVVAVFSLLSTGSSSLNSKAWFVAPFEVQTANQSLGWLREGAVNMLTLTLSQWQDLSVVDYERTLDLLRAAQMDDGARRVALEDARDVARRAGAGTLVMGQVTTTPDSLLVVARLYDVNTGQRIDEAQRGGLIDGDPRVVFEAVARELLDLVGAPALTLELTKQTTTSVEAYRTYLDGTRLLNRWKLAAADSAFERAIALDSTFALAHYKRSQGLGWSNITGESYVRAAEQAVQYKDRLPATLQALVDGNLDLARGFTAINANDLEAARAAWSSAQARFATAVAKDSTNAEAWYSLADADYHAAMQGGNIAPDSLERVRELARMLTRSARSFNRAISLDSTFHLAYQHLVSLYQVAASPATGLLLRGDSIIALESNEAVERLGGRDAVLAMKDSAQVRAREAALGWLAQDPDGQQAYFAAVTAVLGDGDADSAVRILERALDRPAVASPELGFLLANTHLLRRDPVAVAIVDSTLRRWPLDDPSRQGAVTLSRFAISSIQPAGAAGRVQLVDSLVDLAAAIDPTMFEIGTDTRSFGRLYADAMKLAMGVTPTAPLVRSVRRASAALDTLSGPRAVTRAYSTSIPYVTYLVSRDTTDLVRARRWLMESNRLPAVPELDALAALERGDTASARALAATFPRSDSTGRSVQTLAGMRITARAEVLARLGDLRGAVALLETINPLRFTAGMPEPGYALLSRSEFVRGQLYEQLGETPKAIAAYEKFASLWADADPPVDAELMQARAAIARLRDRSGGRPVGGTTGSARRRDAADRAAGPGATTPPNPS